MGDAGGTVVGAVEVEVSWSGVGVGDAPAGDGDGDEEFEGALEWARAELAVISGAGDGLDDGLGPGETKAGGGKAFAGGEIVEFLAGDGFDVGGREG